MLAALLLLAAPEPTAIDAERAFNRAAQSEGQWTAFRRYAQDDAVMFTPQPVNAQQFLKPLKEPKIAVQWWPAESYVSCDGTTAVNTGPWVRPGGNGYFTTVWHRQADGGWKWSYDGGDELKTPRALPDPPKVRGASCKGKPPAVVRVPVAPNKTGGGSSPDGTLTWTWVVNPEGARTFQAELWDGTAHVRVVNDRVGDWN